MRSLCKGRRGDFARAVAIAIALTSVVVLAAWLGAAGFRARAADSNTAVIVNSGSTNTAGFRIVVERSGSAEFTPTPRRSGPGSREKPKNGKVPAPLIQNLYSDLEAATPLSSLPAPRCMKSASFGTRLTIELGDEATPDLNCGDGGNAELRDLIRDANQIVALFTTK